MNLRSIALTATLMAAAAGATAFFLARPAISQEGGMDQDAIMQAYMKAAEPGPHHKKLAACAGNWTFKGKDWWTGTEQPSEGTTSFEPILGGRYVLQRMKSMMNGMPFEGFEILGFDNVSQEHFAIWVDSMSTGYMTMAGKTPAQGQPLVLKGQAKDAMTPQGRPFRYVHHEVSKDEFRMEMYDTIPGADGVVKETKVMEATYTRAR